MDKIQEAYDGELIDSSRISVVIQGLTYYVSGNKNCLYYECVNSIKKYLPNAEIIVSTWKGQQCDESVVDIVIYNDEPESIFDSYGGIPWNFNKMLISTKNGIQQSSREYVLKFRSDLSINNNNFFYIRSKKNIPNDLKKFNFFSEAVNVANLSIKNPCSYEHLLFHLSDIVQFGKRQYVEDIWNIDTILSEDLLINLNLLSLLFYNGIECKRMVPEQALMIGWLNKKSINLKLKYPAYTSFEYVKISELAISLNFNVLSWQNVGVNYPNRFIENKKYLKKYLYNADYINSYYTNYDNFFFFFRYLKIFCNVWLFKFFSDHYLSDFRKTLAMYIIKRVFK
jgi:hypothetical protein